MENEKKPYSNKKNIIVAGSIILLIFIVIAIIMLKKDKPVDGNNLNENQSPVEAPITSGDENNENESEVSDSVSLEDEGLDPILKGAVSPVSGADLITTEGKVVTQDGIEVRTDVAYNSPEAPNQTLELSKEETEKIVGKSTSLTLNADGFSPKEFKIGPGEALTVTLTGSDNSSHILAFEDPKLRAVYINIRPGETRAITFNVPKEKGSYVFFDDFPGARERGLEGVMIVE